MNQKTSYNYPFNTDAISIKDAIIFIADCAYPKDDCQLAKKRVRTTVRSEYKGLVRFNSQGDECVDAMEFFAWAVTKKKWKGGLAQVGNLPLSPVTARLDGIMPGFSSTGYGVVVPLDRKELENGYVKAMSKAHHLEGELARLTEQNSLLRKEVYEWKEKDAIRRATASESGKKNRGISRNS